MISYKKIFRVLVYMFAIIGLFFTLAYGAIKVGLTNVSGVNERQLKQNIQAEEVWKTPEWQTLKAAIIADAPTIIRAAHDATANPRMIVAELVVEQMRLFTSNRELFKEVFEPLKILGVQSQYSWGVMGLKQDTAVAIENNLKDPTSPYYLGDTYAHMLDYKPGEDPDSTRFARLTDEHNHYFSYVYTGLYLAEINHQWQKAGFDIHTNVGVLSTLYNIGFTHSKPNAAPEVGGAEIDIGTTTFSFGSLAQSFYNSSELTSYFPL
jgi:hypothetical protein